MATELYEILDNGLFGAEGIDRTEVRNDGLLIVTTDGRAFLLVAAEILDPVTDPADATAHLSVVHDDHDRHTNPVVRHGREHDERARWGTPHLHEPAHEPAAEQAEAGRGATS